MSEMERAESMIERVARAMVRLNFKHLPEAERDKGVNMVMNVTGDIERERARAAIAALREATAEMINAVPMEPTAERVRYYSEMIDAALK